jgi:hypothetical protein
MKSIIVLLLSTFMLSSVSAQTLNTKAAVTLIGGVIRSKYSDQTDKKYKRKDCPVCKGKGWYMSGDGIKKIECLYCEPESKSSNDCSDDKCNTFIKKGK